MFNRSHNINRKSLEATENYLQFSIYTNDLQSEENFLFLSEETVQLNKRGCESMGNHDASVKAEPL